MSDNKNRFIEILRSVSRENADIEGLIEKLESSDFFDAPASTRFHCSYPGGLVEHCLKVYDNLKMLIETKDLDINSDSIIICGLLHDISKMGIYEKSMRNEKVYREDGSKSDNLGRFDWVSRECYKVKDASQRFIYSNHESTAEFMVRCYIPLKVEESVAIMHHHGGLGYDSIPSSAMSDIYIRYPLVTLLHVADMMSTFIDEK